MYRPGRLQVRYEWNKKRETASLEQRARLLSETWLEGCWSYLQLPICARLPRLHDGLWLLGVCALGGLGLLFHTLRTRLCPIHHHFSYARALSLVRPRAFDVLLFCLSSRSIFWRVPAYILHTAHGFQGPVDRSATSTLLQHEPNHHIGDAHGLPGRFFLCSERGSEE